MFLEIRADLLKTVAPGSLVVLPVNTVGVSGRGLALWMKIVYPEALKHYVKMCRRGKIVSGEMVVIDVGKYKLAMFPTKIHWSGASDLALIKDSFKRLVQWMNDNNVSHAHAPHVGCGKKTGTLDWETEVKPIAESFFKDDETLSLTAYDWN